MNGISSCHPTPVHCRIITLPSGRKELKFGQSNLRVPLSPNNAEFLRFVQGVNPFYKGYRRLSYILYRNELYVGNTHRDIISKYSLSFLSADLKRFFHDPSRLVLLMGRMCIYPMPNKSSTADKELGIKKKNRDVLFIDCVSDFLKSIRKDIFPEDYALQQLCALEFFPRSLKTQDLILPVILLEDLSPASQGIRVDSLNDRNVWIWAKNGIRVEVH